MISEKQLLANQQNALKSTGPKTDQGKDLACRNSLRHGLLAKEVVINEGEGAESREEFDALWADFVDYYKPANIMEEMFVETIAVCYWRKRRALRYETGIIQGQAGTVTNKNSVNEYYNVDVDIDQEIGQHQIQIREWRADLKELKKIYKQDEDLTKAYELDHIWEILKEGLSNSQGCLKVHVPKSIINCVTLINVFPMYYIISPQIKYMKP